MKTILRFFIISFIVFLAEFASGQNNSSLLTRPYVLSSSITYQNIPTGEFNIILARVGVGRTKFLIKGFRIGSEFALINSSIIAAPKIGYEYDGWLFCYRLSEVNYIDGANLDARILPEIGFSFRNHGNICYGYNIHLIGNNIDKVSRHRVSLTYNLIINGPKGK